MASLWTAWDAREREISLQPIPQWRNLRSLAIQLGLCAAAAVWLLTFAASGSFVLALDARTPPRMILGIVSRAMPTRPGMEAHSCGAGPP